MEQRVTILTVRVDDLDAINRYYVDGLGWQPFLAVPGEVTFFQVGAGVALSFFDARGFDADAGGPLRFPFAFAHNVGRDDDVREIVRQMTEAGGTVVKEPQSAEWGGYHAFVADPAGFCWEVAHNPGWTVAEDGTVAIGPAQ
jgi:uncharacterized protein